MAISIDVDGKRAKIGTTWTELNDEDVTIILSALSDAINRHSAALLKELAGDKE